VHRPLAVAVVLVAAGVAAIAVADPLSPGVPAVLLVGGFVAVVVGTVFAAPGVIRVGGRLARRLPFASRLALRDLARYQARAASALAAVTLGLAMAVGIVAVAAANEPKASEGNLADHELIVWTSDVKRLDNADLSASQLADLERRAADVIAALGDDVSTAPLDVAMGTGPAPDSLPPEPVTLGIAIDADSIEGHGVPYVAMPEMLGLYGIDPSSIAEGTELLTTTDEPYILLDFTGRPDLDDDPAPAQHVDLPSWEDAPHALITESAMAAHGWVPVRLGWIVESATAFSDEQIRAARQVAADLGIVIEDRDQRDDLAALRNGATVTGVILAVAIVVMAVGLIRSEARRDVRTLTATGASPRTRRAISASTAAGLAVPGVLLGIAGAYVALLAAYRTDLGRLTPLPLTQLAQIAVGAPLAAAGLGWLLAGREPRTFARQDLE
jgi:putative ABC transport system permease protein